MASIKPTGSTSDIRIMERSGIPVTLENWLDYMYPDGVPDDWMLELDVPVELEQDYKRLIGEE